MKQIPKQKPPKPTASQLQKAGLTESTRKANAAAWQRAMCVSRQVRGQ